MDWRCEMCKKQLDSTGYQGPATQWTIIHRRNQLQGGLHLGDLVCADCEARLDWVVNGYGDKMLGSPLQISAVSAGG